MLDQKLQRLDEAIEDAEAKYEEEKKTGNEDWQTYYGGMVDGLRKAKEIVDHPWQG